MSKLLVTGDVLQNLHNKLENLNKVMKENKDTSLIHDGLNDEANISPEEKEKASKLAYEFLVDNKVICINDEEQLDQTLMPGVMQNVLNLGLVAVNQLPVDDLDLYVPNNNSLRSYHDGLAWYSLEFTGAPNIYTHRNPIPLMTSKVKKNQRKALLLQIAVEQILLYKNAPVGRNLAMGGYDVLAQYNGEARAAAESLLMTGRNLKYLGIPALGVEGIYTSSNLPPAIKVESWYSSSSPTQNFHLILIGINKLMTELGRKTGVGQTANLDAVLVVPARYASAFINFFSETQTVSILKALKDVYPNLDIVFSQYVPETKLASGNWLETLLLFAKKVPYYDGTMTETIQSFCGLDYTWNPLSVHQPTNKVEHGLYLMSTAGAVILSSKHVVVGQMETYRNEN